MFHTVKQELGTGPGDEATFPYYHWAGYMIYQNTLDYTMYRNSVINSQLHMLFNYKLVIVDFFDYNYKPYTVYYIIIIIIILKKFEVGGK